jgi:hypothetical protein
MGSKQAPHFTPRAVSSMAEPEAFNLHVQGSTPWRPTRTRARTRQGPAQPL